ncbi:hypothetical protein E7T09_07695 [Deinococcus sp. KSM4-11]|uniref:Agd3-related carbohydrate-binding protein n=1 Tax=Deinococcus sp. KSM4-11 TaxID=2568654 RepID=UPI0010A53818|nr:hypothetical protein [Deinococcus sp. KSM4-11]THF87046.1 hypothetical protein E7T09_07695 [Deinococcus sp. KSM4-11]
MKRSKVKRSLRLGALLPGLILAACSTTPSPETSGAAVPGGTTTRGGTHAVTLAAPALPDGRALTPLRQLTGAKPVVATPLRSLAVQNTAVVALRVLILTASSTDSALSDAQTMLDQAGVPYDVVNPSVPGAFTADTLVAADGTGKYQGVILTTGNLAYEASPGNWQSALDWAGWNLLWQYETDYQARQLSLYTYPSTWPEDYGLRDAGVASATADPVMTTTGRTVFKDLKAGLQLPIRNAYNYPATLATVAGTTTTPLLTDTAGRVLAATSTATFGTGTRERLALTFAQNPYLLHSALISPSLVNWLTKGVYVGEYRRYNQLDIDDWFLPGDVFNETTLTIQPDAFRLSASDALAVRNQQTALQNAFSVSSNFTFSMVFNGGGANTSAPASCDPNVVSPDPLTSMSRCLKWDFDWVSHTLQHEYMDSLNYADSLAQLKPNIDVAQTLDLNLSRKSLVTGDMSGLGYYNPAGDGPKTNYGLKASNVNFLQAAQKSGDVYLASNHSVDGQWDPTCMNCGIVHPLNASIFLVPRWPTNVFYSVTTPAQMTAAYNSVYGPGGTLPFWDHNLSYTEIQDKESDIALSHLLSGGAFPHYMHQDNLRQYATGRSLAYDWESALLTKYMKYSTLPLKTLRWDAVGAYVKSRTTFMKSGLSGRWDRVVKTVTLTSARGGDAYVTGVTVGTTQTYAGQKISTLTLMAGQSVTAPVP